jgi:hypothetical protein
VFSRFLIRSDGGPGRPAVEQIPVLPVLLDVLCSFVYGKAATTPPEELRTLRHSLLKNMILLFELSRSHVSSPPCPHLRHEP